MRKIVAKFMLPAFFLAGCAGLSVPVGTSSEIAPTGTLAKAPLPRQKPQSHVDSRAAPAVPPRQGPVAGEKRANPRTLVGLDEQATRSLLGEPNWTEDVPPARYWQYATPSCVLRVFFFMEMNTRNFRALSYELTSTDDAPHVDEQCFAQLLSQAAASRQAAYHAGE